MNHQLVSSTNAVSYSCVLSSYLKANAFSTAHVRFVNYHGEKNHRIRRDQTVHASVQSKDRSLILKILSPLLFSAPDVHLQALRRIYVDRLVIESAWKVFIDKLNKEWQEFLLLVRSLFTVAMQDSAHIKPTG